MKVHPRTATIYVHEREESIGQPSAEPIDSFKGRILDQGGIPVTEYKGRKFVVYPYVAGKFKWFIVLRYPVN